MTPFAQVIKDACQRVEVRGTSGHSEGYGPPYKAPWYVVDNSTAEHEVNWWGELLSEHATAEAAHDARWEAIAQLILGDKGRTGRRAIDDLEALIPNERTVMLAAAAAPAAFLAVHGCSASEYIQKFHELKALLAQVRAHCP